MEIRYKKAVIRQTVDGVEMETEVMLPDFGDEDEPEQKPIGIWGRRHLRYLRDYKDAVYRELLMEGKLNAYLADIDRQAEEMLFRLVRQMAERDGVTEALKAKDAMMWVGLMNNIRSRAAEVVYNDLIYIYN